MLSLAEAKPVHARWSDANREFLEFVERNPEYLSRARFADLSEDPTLRRFSLQPWPLFLGPAQQREVEGVALGIDRLMKRVIERILAGDRERIRDLYRSNIEANPEAALLALPLDDEYLDILLEEPTGVRGAPSRADYIETRDGLKCIEYNSGGFIGGLQTGSMAEAHLRSASTARFLRERGLRARAPDTLGALFRHVVEDTARLGVWKGGEFNVGMLVYPHDPPQVAVHSAELYTRELRRVLAEDGRAEGGQVFLCHDSDFVVEGGEVVTVEGRPVHAVIEQHNGFADIRVLLWHFKQGHINFYSGPIAGILCDKRNLALVSEQAGSDDFTAAERELIAQHVPWTRTVRSARTRFRGRTVRLPDDLPELREAVVLKKATSLGGADVHVGRFCGEARWREMIARAQLEEDWVVQEYLESVPYQLQSGDEGAAPFDMVWGLFAFGHHFGGAFLRMQPAGEDSTGVVNVAQGAETGVMLEIVE